VVWHVARNTIPKDQPRRNVRASETAERQADPSNLVDIDSPHFDMECFCYVRGRYIYERIVFYINTLRDDGGSD
jgi:hypothetical protein